MRVLGPPPDRQCRAEIAAVTTNVLKQIDIDPSKYPKIVGELEEFLAGGGDNELSHILKSHGVFRNALQCICFSVSISFFKIGGRFRFVLVIWFTLF